MCFIRSSRGVGQGWFSCACGQGQQPLLCASRGILVFDKILSSGKKRRQVYRYVRPCCRWRRDRQKWRQKQFGKWFPWPNHRASSWPDSFVQLHWIHYILLFCRCAYQPTHLPHPRIFQTPWQHFPSCRRQRRWALLRRCTPLHQLAHNVLRRRIRWRWPLSDKTSGHCRLPHSSCTQIDRLGLKPILGGGSLKIWTILIHHLLKQIHTLQLIFCFHEWGQQT